MSDPTLQHIPAPGTAALYDVGTGPNQIPVLSEDPGETTGGRFLRDDGTWAAAAGDAGPPGIPNPEVGEDLGESGSAFEVSDMSTATVAKVELTANTTVTFPGSGDSGDVKSFTLVVVQDDTGGRTITWPNNVLWAGGAAPGLSPAAGAVDVFSFMSDVTDDVWYGFAGGFGFA